MTSSSNSAFHPASPFAKAGRIPLYFGLAILLTPAALLAAEPTDAPVGSAQSAPHRFNIGKQPLYSALNALAEQGGVQLVFTEEMVKGLASPGVSGDMPLEQALSQALQGTGLKYRISGSTVTLEASPTDAGHSGLAPAAMPAVTVVGKAIYDSTDPYNPAYSLPKAMTATKTETPNMETPVNIQIIPKAVLNDQQVIQMTDALRNVSGATFSNGSGGISDDVFLRGFRAQTYFRNGFRTGNAYSSVGNRQMANVERIEVVKGPAAVMYGRMEPGGMVSVVTKRPLATPYYALQQQFGSFDQYRTTLDATGPITEDDTLLYRFNASFESADSFRELVDKERTFIAPIVTWNISPRTQVSLEMEYRYDKLSYDQNAWPYINDGFISMPKSRNLMEYSPVTVEEKLIALDWSHQFNDNWDIKQKFVTNLQNRTENWIVQSGLINNSTLARTRYFVPGEYNTYYTELNLTGNFQTGVLEHTLLIGGDYYREDSKNDPYIASMNPIDIFQPAHNSDLTSELASAGWGSDNSADFFGIYAQDQIKLPYGFHVTGGLRYQNVKQWNNVSGVEQPTDDAVTPRVGVLWQAKTWLSLYGNYVENFGASNLWATTRTGKPLSPESAQQWEVGAKFEFFDGKLSATLAYYDITKQNVATRDTSDNSGIYSIAAGEVRSKGPEIDVRGEILDGWNLIATYANFDTRVTKDNNGLEGNRLFAVPRNVGTLWSTYEIQNGDFSGLKFGGGMTLRDGSTDGGSTNYQTTGYVTVDLLSAYSWKVGKSKMTAQLNVNNLLDKDYFPDAYVPANIRTIGAPRSFLGSIKVEF